MWEEVGKRVTKDCTNGNGQSPRLMKWRMGIRTETWGGGELDDILREARKTDGTHSGRGYGAMSSSLPN